MDDPRMWDGRNARLTKADVPEYSDGGCDVDHRSRRGRNIRVRVRDATQEVPRIIEGKEEVEGG